MARGPGSRRRLLDTANATALMTTTRISVTRCAQRWSRLSAQAYCRITSTTIPGADGVPNGHSKIIPRNTSIAIATQANSKSPLVTGNARGERFAKNCIVHGGGERTGSRGLCQAEPWLRRMRASECMLGLCQVSDDQRRRTRRKIAPGIQPNPRSRTLLTNLDLYSCAATGELPP